MHSQDGHWFWTGQAWVPAQVTQRPITTLVVVGWIFTFLMPIVGIILGIIGTVQGRRGARAQLITVCCLVGLVVLTWLNAASNGG